MHLRQIVVNLLVRALRPALQTALDEDSRCVRRARQRRAVEDTAAFIDSELATVRSFDTAQALLRHALSEVGPITKELVCEFGVFEGASIRLIANALPTETIFGFDSFEGLPEDWRDGFPHGTFKLARLPEVPKNVVLVKGWFSETLKPFLAEHSENASFLHVDCDLYSSTKCVLDAFAPRIRSGTIIVFDEFFNHVGWREGEFKAFTEFAERTQLRFEYIGYTGLEQVGVRIL
jgi:hypothetical protein